MPRGRAIATRAAARKRCCTRRTAPAGTSTTSRVRNAVERVQKVGRDDLVGRPALPGIPHVIAAQYATAATASSASTGAGTPLARDAVSERARSERLRSQASARETAHPTCRRWRCRSRPIQTRLVNSAAIHWWATRCVRSAGSTMRTRSTPRAGRRRRVIGRGILDAQFVKAAVERYRQRHLPRTVRSGVVDGESVVEVQVGTAVRYQPRRAGRRCDREPDTLPRSR
jgi:hypothetical protein